MAIVGTAFIRVKLLSNKVGDDIKKAVGDSFKDVGKDVNKASEDLGRKMGDGIGDGIKDSPAIQQAGNTVADNVSKNVNKGFNKNRRKMRGFFISWLVGGLLAVGPSLIAGGLQIVAALGASLVALASTLGAAFGGALVAGLGVFVAVKSTLALIKLALKEDTEALKEFNNNVKDLKSEIGGAVQVGLLPGLNSAVNNLRKSLPALRKQLVATGKTVGDLANNFTKALTTGQNLGRINKVLANNNKFIGLAGQGLTKMAEAALILLSHLGPVTDFIGQLVKDIGDWLLVTTQTAEANGTLTTKINEWFELTKRAVGVLVDFGVGLFNIFKGARESGDILFAGIETAASNFRDWTASVSGQNAIKKFFADALPLAQETWGLIGDIFKLIGGVSFGDNQGALGFVKTLREEVVPAFADIFRVIGENTGDEWSRAFENFSKAVQDLAKSGALGATANAISAIAQAVSFLLTVPFVPTILSWGATFLLLNKMLFGFPAILLNFITKPLQNMFKSLGTMALNAGKQFGMFLLRGLGRALARLGIYLLELLLEAVLSAWPAIAAALASIPVVGWIILAVAAVIAILVVLYLKVKGFRDKINEIWQSIVDFFKDVWQEVSDFFIAIWEPISDVFSDVWDHIRSTFQSVFDFIVSTLMSIHAFFRAAFAPVITVVTFVMDVIRKLFEIGFKIIEIVVKLFTAVVIIAFEAARLAVISKVKPIWDFVVGAFNAIKLAVQTRLAEIRANITTIFNFVSAYVSAVWKTIHTRIRNALLAIRAIIRAVFGPIWDYIRGIFRDISAYISYRWNQIHGTISGALKLAWGAVSYWFGRIRDFVAGIIETVRGTISGVWGSLTEGLKSQINKVIDGVNIVIGLVNKVIGVANKLGGSIDPINPISHLAKGGVVPATPGGRVALLAEAGRPERVEPLDKDGLSKRDREIVKALSTAGGSGGPTTVNVYIGQEKLDAIVETKIEENNENLAQQIVTGRR